MDGYGMQQFVVLLKSVVIGGVIGILLDAYSGFLREKRYRYSLFVSDVLFGLVAAMVTFFGALIVTDGYLHPVLMVGIGCGCIAEHWLIGRWLAVLFFWLHCALRFLLRNSQRFLVFLLDFVRKQLRKRGRDG